jgi:hypothetical protein
MGLVGVVVGMFGDVRFSNRPFEVKHFQTIHQCGVDVAGGLVLLFGIGLPTIPTFLMPATGIILLFWNLYT